MLNKTCLIVYVPVIHNGVLKLIHNAREIPAIILVIDDDIVEELIDRAEIRALPAADALLGIQGMLYNCRSMLVTKLNLDKIVDTFDDFIIANDEVCRRFAAKYLKGKSTRFSSVFLRWDEASVDRGTDVVYDRTSEDEDDIDMIQLAREVARDSSDWWRQVGVVVLPSSSDALTAYNAHVPTEYAPYIDGDPRDVIAAGTRSEVNTALHSEQAIITYAARLGICLEGAIMYVTTFPCPMCAKQVAAAGIKTLYFAEGHSSLDGEAVLKAYGVELVYVKTPS